MKYKIYTVTDGTTIAVTEAAIPEDNNGFLQTGEIAEQSARASSYGRDIRGIVRGLWGGVIDINQAFALLSDTVRIGLTRAWHEGAAECGIQPSELSPEELMTLRHIIAGEDRRIFPFLLTIDDGSKANGGRLAPLLSRAAMWALRYDDVVARAKLMACADQKTRWTINYHRVIKDNCPSCLKLEDKVKRNGYWYTAQVQPQNPPNQKLKCGGWRCGCGLPETDEPLSRGPLPRLP